MIEHTVEKSEVDDASGFVANGGAAMVAYGELHRRDLAQPQRDQLRQQLLRYCELDTLAMVVCDALAHGVREEE